MLCRAKSWAGKNKRQEWERGDEQQRGRRNWEMLAKMQNSVMLENILLFTCTH